MFDYLTTYLRSTNFEEIRHIGVIGHSHGGTLAARLVKKLADEFDQPTDPEVTFLATVDAVQRHNGDLGIFDFFSIDPAFDDYSLNIGDVHHYNIYQDVSHLRGKFLSWADQNHHAPAHLGGHTVFEKEDYVISRVVNEVRDYVLD